jgi:hypothetical protein
MKRWALVVILLYGLILLALTWPVVWAGYGFTAFGLLTDELSPDGPREFLQFWVDPWGYWIWLGVMLLSQGALLAVPVQLVRQRPVTRRSLWPTLLASGLMLAVLLGSLLLAVNTLLVGEDGEEGLLQVGEQAARWWWPRFYWSLLAITLLLWAGWTWVFRRVSQLTEARDLMALITRYLLAGSILELLVAVPSHILVRRRGECCAHFATFWGIAMGISVMLFSFGPGVLFLYAARCRRLRPETKRPGSPRGIPTPGSDVPAD